jgi:undecaprenyl-phosphate 4-deoxy-4-formamido-L-arabinose transferase
VRTATVTALRSNKSLVWSNLLEKLASISAIIPVYRGEQTLAELAGRLETVLSQVAREYEIIFVNDGSPDNSWQVIQGLCAHNPHIRGIRLMRNYGQHNATLCGVRAARGEVIITLDDDMQHPPEEIPLLLARLAEGWEVVYGIPHKRPHSWWRNLFSVLIKRSLAWVMDIGTIRDIGAFRAFRADLRRAFEDYQNPNVILDVLLSWGTGKFSTVNVREDPRAEGRSNYNFARLFRVALTILTAYSTKPLRFASFLGFGFTVFGLGVFLYVVYIYLFLGSIEGFPFLASIIAIFSGVQLFALGIIGEYLARVFDRSMDRPTYIVGEEVKR